MNRTIVIGSDHAGYEMKCKLIEFLKNERISFDDCGCYDNNSVDYPDYAKVVVKQVLTTVSSLGILLCGSGIGVSIMANRHKGIRAALCWTEDIARLSRQHNDANVLCMPARFLTVEEMKEIVLAFLNTPFEGGRHQNRINKIENE